MSSAEQFLQFADLLPEAVLLVSADGAVVAGNRAAAHRLGRDRAALARQCLADCVAEPPAELDAYLRACARTRQAILGALTLKLSGGGRLPCRCEGAVYQPRSDAAPALVLLRLFPKETAARGFLALNEKIAALTGEVQRRRRAEQQVREQGEWFRTTLASIGDAVIATDEHGRVTFLNPVAQQLTGWPEKDAVGKPLEEIFVIVNEQTRQPAENPVAKVLREGTVVGLANHTLLLSRDGKERPIDDSAAPIRDPDGNVSGVVLVFHDVTEARRRERELRASEERHRAIAELTSDYALTARVREDGSIALETATDGFAKVTGYTPEELETLGGWSALILPDDLSRARQSVERAVQGHTVRDELRIRTKMGEVRWLHYLLRPVWDARRGRVVRIYNASQDITDRKVAQRVLQESEERFRQLAEHVNDVFWITDPREPALLYISPAYETVWGRSRQSLYEEPESFLDAVHPDDRPRLAESLRRQAAGEATADEYRIIRPDGEVRWVFDRGYPVRDTHGRFYRVVGVAEDVTERRRAEELLRESESQYRVLTEAIPQIVWMTAAKGETEYFNRRWYEYTGTRPDEALGWGWQPVIHPDDLPATLTAWTGSIATGQPYEIQYRLRRADGAYRWHIGRALPLRDRQGNVVRWFGSCTDIDDQRRAAEASRFLAEASRSLAALVDYESTLQKVARLAVPFFADWCAVFLIADDNAIERVAAVHSDPAKERVLDRLHAEHPLRWDSTGGAVRVLRTGRPELVPEITDEMLRQGVADEPYRDLLLQLTPRSHLFAPLTVRQRVLGVISFGISESGRRYGPADLEFAEDLAGRLAVAIENARLYHELREADRRKDEFLAMLAHELRNPLAPVRNALHVLRLPGVDPATVERARNMMERQVEHMVRLVDDLLDVSRIMRGKIELRKEPVELATVLARAVETAQPSIDTQRHGFDLTLPDEPILLEGDLIRLAQVFSNLLTNAAKYTEPGGRITLTAAREGDEAVVRVVDTGVGIAPEQLPHVFDLFVQVETTLARSQGGLGIGLTLVKRLVEMHGGRVAAHSDGPGRGSTFVVRLPALALAQPGRGDAARLMPAGAEGAPCRVLVVDDNKDGAESMAMLLEMWKYEVATAHDGLTGLELALTFRPDMVLLDIGLPGLNGYEVARRLRERPEFAQTFLVAMTGYGQEEDRRRSLEAGFDRHLTKPVAAEDLQECLRRC